jgi:D-aminoacyl-tRNA deacylase
MRALIQRVSKAGVEVEGQNVAEMGSGLLVLLGVEPADAEEDIAWLAGKILRLRIFPDDRASMNRSVQEVGGEMIVVSQFTLFADTRKGNRPSFIGAAAPDFARSMYERFCELLECDFGKKIGRGIFGAHMNVSLINDGPVTIWIDSRNR